jgi:hypothetical protein
MLARKKIVLIFFLAILLPALVVGYMSQEAGGRPESSRVEPLDLR